MCIRDRGEYQDYYKNDYKNQNTEDKKWRGVLKLYLPKEDGTEKDNWTISVFKAFTEAVEESNQGYHWDWDETTLKGKVFEMCIRDRRSIMYISGTFNACIMEAE